MTDVPTANDRVKPFWLFAYSLPGLPVAAMSLPLAVYLPPFYESDVGLGNLAVGIIFGATRFLDVFLDPIMGVLSDRTRTRWGRRKIWMALAVPVMCLASLLVFMPQPGATWPSVVASIFLLFVGYTMLSIAHLAWGSELSSDYHERSKVTASREFCLSCWHDCGALVAGGDPGAGRRQVCADRVDGMVRGGDASLRRGLCPLGDP